MPGVQPRARLSGFFAPSAKHPFVSGLRISVVETARSRASDRRRSTRDARRPIAGPNLDATNVTRRLGCRPAGRNSGTRLGPLRRSVYDSVLGQLDDEIGSAERPPLNRRRAARVCRRSPSTAPCATHRLNRCISSARSRRSPANSTEARLGQATVASRRFCDHFGRSARVLPDAVVSSRLNGPTCPADGSRRSARARSARCPG